MTLPPPAITVCARCEFTTLAAALAAAPAGARIVVRESQRGGFAVRRTVTLEADGTVALDGAGATALEIDAPGVVVHGFRFVPSGEDPRGDHPALVVRAPRATIEGNRFESVPFAISLLRAPDSMIRSNTIVGTGGTFTGDPIRLWVSPRTRVETNTILDGRDVLISYSDDVVIQGNTIARDRYGLHDMFSHRMIVRSNSIADCAIGTNFMYATGIRIVGNRFRHNRGSAGYGIGLESVDDAFIEANVFDDNHIGLKAIDSPSRPGYVNRILDNVFAGNSVGIAAQSNATDVQITGNAFIDNLEQISVSGGNSLPGIVWKRQNRGNFWSDYAGYDLNGDGIGDVPYEPASLFETIADAQPELSLLKYSPAIDVLEFGARAFATVGTQPKLRDEAPLMRPAISADVPRGDGDTKVSLALVALAATGFVPFFALAMFSARKPQSRRGPTPATIRAASPDPQERGPAVVAKGVTKRYGPGRGIESVSFRLTRGEALALWGPNGAGKTTLLRCLLGQVRYTGELLVDGRRPTPDDRGSRLGIGYCPQSLPLFELRARELALLVAELRGVGAPDVERALMRFRLTAIGNVPIAELSGGMRQRFSLALAFIGAPPIVILDEPTAGLDRQARREVLTLLATEKRRGTTLILTSHLFEDVARIADRVIIVEEGHIAGDIGAAEFVARERGGSSIE